MYYYTQIYADTAMGEDIGLDLSAIKNPTHSINYHHVSPGSMTTLTASGTSYDMQDGDLGPFGSRIITVRGDLFGQTETSLDSNFLYLSSLQGATGKIQRIRTSDGAIQEADAKFYAKHGDLEPFTSGVNFMPVEVSAVLLGRPQFHGTSRDITEALTGAPGYAGTAFELLNAGNDLAYDAVITINAVTDNITNFIVSLRFEGNDYVQMVYDGSSNPIVAGTSLVINCGALSVLNNGVNRIANWNRSSTHDITEWFAVKPQGPRSSTTCWCSWSPYSAGSIGEDHTINVTYRDAWRV